MTAGPLKTDALLAVVRTSSKGSITAYAIGEGRVLRFWRRRLVASASRISVSAGAKRTVAVGQRRARQGLEPLPASGTVVLPAAGSQLWVDGAVRNTGASGTVRLEAGR